MKGAKKVQKLKISISSSSWFESSNFESLNFPVLFLSQFLINSRHVNTYPWAQGDSAHQIWWVMDHMGKDSKRWGRAKMLHVGNQQGMLQGSRAAPPTAHRDISVFLLPIRIFDCFWLILPYVLFPSISIHVVFPQVQKCHFMWFCCSEPGQSLCFHNML